MLDISGEFMFFSIIIESDLFDVISYVLMVSDDVICNVVISDYVFK